MKITLREKKIKNGKISLYLDFYPPVVRPDTGAETRREFLKLYLHAKPKNELERSENKETRLLAENVAAKRRLEIQANNYGFLAKSQKNADFLAYYKQQAAKHNSSKSAAQTWASAYLYFADFCQHNCSFKRVDRSFVEKFRHYLLTCPSRRSRAKTLSPNTAASYFYCFCAAVSAAVKEKLLTDNTAAEVEPIKAIDADKEYLTLEELQRLAETEIRMPDSLRRAALFSALTGLRFSDLAALTWENVSYAASTGHCLSFRIKKTGEPLTVHFSDEARELLGGGGDSGDKVFSNLDYGSMTGIYIARWTLAAGITKNITFHSFRHTFATLQLTAGTDLYTVSKMLGHKSIQKTQVYARIVDEKKREAVNRVRLKK